MQVNVAKRIRLEKVWLAVFCLALPAAASAQDRRWEIEGYAGVLAAQPASAGSVTLPPPGPPLVTSSPTFPAHATSSWFFGDGTKLINGVLAELDRAHAIAPLDPAFAPLPSSRPAAFGIRVRRRLNPRVSLEFSLDGLGGSPLGTGNLTDVVNTARDSFIPAFIDLFSSGPFARTSVAAQTAINGDDYRETAFSAAVNRDIGRLGPLQPYFTAGGAIVAAKGTLPSATVVGEYATAIVGEVPIDETDRVDIRISRSTSLAAVLGGGLRHDFSDWAVRIDARMVIGPDTTRVRLDATPSVARGAPAGFIESFTNPAIQFSNDPATGRVSSLSGPALQDAVVFKGGVLARTLITVALSRRF